MPVNRRRSVPLWVLLASALILAACSPKADQGKAGNAADPRLQASFREDRGGWAFVHLQGTPREIGFQHGWHLAAEIDDVLKTMAFYFPKAAGRDWAFFREAAERMFWPKLDQEYKDEIEGIAAGLRARRPDLAYDRIDITALNGWIEIAWYYIPWLADKAKPGSGDNKAPAYCSAFVAIGSWTKDGGVVMAHNNWTEYILGQRWNAVLDIVPSQGSRILMDAMPGYIHSGDDFVVNGAGLIYTETTMGQYKGFREAGTPEFARARKAAQYGASIDDFVRIITADNNGAYGNDWLVADLNAGEIARLELGLKNQRVWRTKDGYYVGANFPVGEKTIAEETTFDPKNLKQSVYVRRARWEKLMEENKGSIDADKAMAFLGDHIDASTGGPADNANTLCGHGESDPNGLPEFSWAAFYPGGAVQGKVTTGVLAKELKLWGRMGHLCGREFIAADFVKAHPEWAWQAPYLKDVKAHPWTLFEAKK
ncbi:MAG: C45 family autoproteolytic acyltransferase/hydrolase [Acidobacteriota bacterium]|nr:C45 family autoproteolytic acyltransferase/hydrolase [Acidobacteriota bacterium]